MQITDSVGVIKGIGEKTEKLFQKLGITTVEELLHFYPREYDIFTQIQPISSVREGEVVVIEGTLATKPGMSNVRNLKIITCKFRDPSGQISLSWFNMPYLMRTLKMGIRYIFRGKVVNKNGMLQITQPKMLTKEEYANQLGKLQPVYPLTAGMTNHTIKKAVMTVLKECTMEKEYLPLEIRKQYSLPAYQKSVRAMHFPKSREEYAEARRRIVFEEFFFFSLALRYLKEHKGRKCSCYALQAGKMTEKFLEELPFSLTEGQTKAWKDVKKDVSEGFVMNRLIQGDVGSGKTVIAMLGLLMAVEAGYQGAIMVPTEVLAKQHYEEFKQRLGGFGVRVELLVGSMTAAQKKQSRKRIANQEADIIVGTHALIQEKVEYKALAFVITDEQHRFGVRQRELFSQKGKEPHVLVMSATPIPRTLAIILYGDLDVSVMEGLPKNRLPIRNCAVGTNYRPQAYRFMEKEVALGHQIYVICPMVEESESTEAENVTDYANTLRQILPVAVRIEVLHGKMKAKEKNDVMERFASGQIDVLVSTTVIEVGINVPNATVMMIENAERFGLAQLHQLRGRVGRGSEQSYCIFMAGNPSKETMERLKVMESSNDGFYIAKKDLELRGPGDLFGIRQSGELYFKLGDIYQDAKELQQANEAASRFTTEMILGLCKKTEGLSKKLERYLGDVAL